MSDVRKFHFQQLNRAQPPIGERWEINEDVYCEFLDMFCPPLRWTQTPTGASFYNPEFDSDDVTTKYTKEGDRFFCEFAEYPGGMDGMLDETQEWSDRLLSKPGTPGYVFADPGNR